MGEVIFNSGSYGEVGLRKHTALEHTASTSPDMLLYLLDDASFVIECYLKHICNCRGRTSKELRAVGHNTVALLALSGVASNFTEEELALVQLLYFAYKYRYPDSKPEFDSLVIEDVPGIVALLRKVKTMASECDPKGDPPSGINSMRLE